MNSANTENSVNTEKNRPIRVALSEFFLYWPSFSILAIYAIGMMRTDLENADTTYIKIINNVI